VQQRGLSCIVKSEEKEFGMLVHKSKRGQNIPNCFPLSAHVQMYSKQATNPSGRRSWCEWLCSVDAPVISLILVISITVSRALVPEGNSIVVRDRCGMLEISCGEDVHIRLSSSGYHKGRW
jgi:hypothetical protein